MTKLEFLDMLRACLSGLPQSDIDERLAFYCEMIEDRMEEGLSEEEAVSAVGDIEEIAKQIIAEVPLAKIAKERIKPKRRLMVWEIILLALGSPIWLSLGIALFAVILSVYVALWSVIISLWAVFVSVAACVIGGVASGVVLAVYGNGFTGVAMIAAGIVCAGLSIFLFYGCKLATKGIVILTKKLALWIKHCFMKREDA